MTTCDVRQTLSISLPKYCVCELQSSTGAGSVVVVNDEGDTLGLMTAR